MKNKSEQEGVVAESSKKNGVFGKIVKNNQTFIFRKTPTDIYSNSFNLVVTNKNIEPIVIYENVSSNNRALYSENLAELKKLIPDSAEKIDGFIKRFLSEFK